jgi:FtsX-like permease family
MARSPAGLAGGVGQGGDEPAAGGEPAQDGEPGGGAPGADPDQEVGRGRCDLRGQGPGGEVPVCEQQHPGAQAAQQQRGAGDLAAGEGAEHGAQANPENPSAVDVTQPSDVLTAQADTASAFNDLFLGPGAVALLVGAVGIANITVISVLERRQEIGLRRALGATRGQIRIQLLAEAILLSLAGGVVGAAATAIYARAHSEAIVIPPGAWAGGLTVTLLIGAVAGL